MVIHPKLSLAKAPPGLEPPNESLRGPKVGHMHHPCGLDFGPAIPALELFFVAYSEGPHSSGEAVLQKGICRERPPNRVGNHVRQECFVEQTCPCGHFMPYHVWVPQSSFISMSCGCVCLRHGLPHACYMPGFVLCIS